MPTIKTSRLAAAAFSFVMLMLMTAAPAAAIDNAQFGLQPAEVAGKARTELRIDIKAGKTSSDSVVLRNHTRQPLTVRLLALPATIDPAGQVRLEGDQSVVRWTRFSDQEVNLPPGGQRVVEMSVRAPAKISSETKALAVVAEPVAPAGTTPVVVQRLALRTILSPHGDSLIVSLGLLPWLGAALLAAVSAVAAFSWRRQAA